jgi:putative selenium metabolism protein SsnA
MSRTFIGNGIVYTGKEVLSPATIAIEGDRILEIVPGALPEKDLPGGQDRWIDATGRLVTPGLVNAHTHIYSALARGIALKDPPPTNFLETLERLWWRLDRALTMEDIELSARLHGVECLRSGVTTIFDHHSSQHAIRGSLQTISAALEDLGLRACLCFEVSDRDGPAAAAAGIEENRSFLRECAGADGSMRRAKFGLHASFTLSNETLKAGAAAGDADGAGFHIHVAEGTIDQALSRERYGCGVIERLKEFGILGKKTIAVHGVHLDDREIEILAASGAWHAHCPQSNMNNAVGAPVLSRFGRAGIRTALGTDGFTANMFREGLAAHLLQTHMAGVPGAGYETVPDLLFGANAALARETFGVEIGHLTPGAPADLVVWDYVPPTPIAKENIWGHVLFGLVNARAMEVMIAGRHRLTDGRLFGGDEDAISARCREAAERLWERF